MTKTKFHYRRIRRVSLDRFYELVTGQKDAFYNMCMILPDDIEKVVSGSEDIKVPDDTVVDELRNISLKLDNNTGNIAMAVYMLGFSSYNGFKECLSDVIIREEDMLKRLYKYAKMQ